MKENFKEKQFEKEPSTHFKKEILCFNEAIEYLGLSKSSLYKLTSKRKIKFFKPNGGKIYFRKVDLNKWMLQNGCLTKDEMKESLIKQMHK